VEIKMPGYNKRRLSDTEIDLSNTDEILTKKLKSSEEKAEKKRKQNIVSARKYRSKRKSHEQDSEVDYLRLTKENHLLRDENQRLRDQVGAQLDLISAQTATQIDEITALERQVYDLSTQNTALAETVKYKDELLQYAFQSLISDLEQNEETQSSYQNSANPSVSNQQSACTPALSLSVPNVSQFSMFKAGPSSTNSSVQTAYEISSSEIPAQQTPVNQPSDVMLVFGKPIGLLPVDSANFDNASYDEVIMQAPTDDVDNFLSL
jgi:hypothetical protein